MKKSRLFAPFLMLLAAALASIIMFRGSYDTTEMLVILLFVMIFFYAAGVFIQKKISSFVEQIREEERIEAENEGEESEQTDQIPEEDASEQEGNG